VKVMWNVSFISYSAFNKIIRIMKTLPCCSISQSFTLSTVKLSNKNNKTMEFNSGSVHMHSIVSFHWLQWVCAAALTLRRFQWGCHSAMHPDMNERSCCYLSHSTLCGVRKQVTVLCENQSSQNAIFFVLQHMVH
jgi:hypothetical protein